MMGFFGGQFTKSKLSQQKKNVIYISIRCPWKRGQAVSTWKRLMMLKGGRTKYGFLFQMKGFIQCISYIDEKNY